MFKSHYGNLVPLKREHKIIVYINKTKQETLIVNIFMANLSKEILKITYNPYCILTVSFVIEFATLLNYRYTIVFVFLSLLMTRDNQIINFIFNYSDILY